MLYIFNKTISNSKSILYSLTILYGINEYQSKKICKSVGINPQITVNKLKNYQVNRLIDYINKNLKIEQVLKQFNKNKLNELLEIKSIRGIRRSAGLPVRGQRTHTNAKTAKKFKKVFGKKHTKQVIKGKGKKFVKKKK
jgi:small subunit ribosomal protein S13